MDRADKERNSMILHLLPGQEGRAFSIQYLELYEDYSESPTSAQRLAIL